MVALGILGGYVAVSVVLFKFPTLVHRKKHLKFRCPHVSHRGGAGENLENTLTAYKHAVSLGTDMLELDVQLTRDGQVVVSHDNNLLRSTGHDVNISQLDYADLPPLKPSLPIDFDSSRMCIGGEDRRIPLLKEVFESFPQMTINIDIKTNNDRLIAKVSDMVCEFGREDYSIWGNFSSQVTDKCYRHNPRIPLLFSAKGVVKLYLLTYTGLLPFIPLRESCLEAFLPSLTFKKTLDFSKDRRWLQLAVWIIDKMLMRRFIFDHLRKRGIQTYLWVLNTDEDYERAFKLGVTGVMTDYPTRLKEFLERNPHYR